MTVDLVGVHELYQAKARHCRVMHTKDWGALGELLTEELEFDLCDGNPEVAPIVGRDNVLASVAGAKTVHQIHIPEIEVSTDGGDAAYVVWPVQERVVRDSGTSLTAYGHYRGRWVRVDGQWKCASRKLTHLVMDFG